MEPHRRGELTEALVIAELKRREIPVSKPVGDNERYDLVAESDGGLWRLQVKTGRLQDGTIRFHGTSQHTNAQGNVYERYDGVVDFFVVYVDELESMYLLPESAFETDIRLRVEEPSQADSSINWARDFAFDQNWPPEAGPTHPTTRAGVITERLAEHGVSVALPQSDQAYDALAEGPAGEIYRLQLERGWVVDGRIRFDTGDKSHQRDPDAIDYVVVYCAEVSQLYLIARDGYDVTISLRIEEPKQRNSRINWADDYEFGRNWPPA